MRTSTVCVSVHGTEGSDATSENVYVPTVLIVTLAGAVSPVVVAKGTAFWYHV